MLRVLALVVGVVLVAATALFLACGDDDDAPSSVTATQTSAIVVTPTPSPGGDPVIEYELRVIDWGERLRVASLTIAEKIALYGQDITAVDDVTVRNEMFDAFNSIGDVKAEWEATTAPEEVVDVRGTLRDSLDGFVDAQANVTLAYTAWDGGEREQTAGLLNEAANAMNNANNALNQAIAAVTDPDR
jgi:hypothetical protein